MYIFILQMKEIWLMFHNQLFSQMFQNCYHVQPWEIKLPTEVQYMLAITLFWSNLQTMECTNAP